MTLTFDDKKRAPETQYRYVEDPSFDERLKYMADAIAEAGDDERALRMGELRCKLRSQMFSLVFCGHFSAGKSTMVNSLIGESVLPSGPVPTSANLVRIQAGNERAVRIQTRSGQTRELPSTVEVGRLQDDMKDGEDIESVTVTALAHWPEKTEIIDTPGMDSTDDAHRLSAESALHSADGVFFIMDYNHVQAEWNFEFVKRLQERGRSVFLIVNQMDKHDERELPLADFKKKVRDAFSDWGIHPEGLFFTTMLPDVPGNELSELDAALTQMLRQRRDRLMKNLLISAQNVIDDHAKWLQKHRRQDEGAQDAYHRKKDELHRLRERQNELYDQVRPFEQSFTERLNALLDAANLTPYETRERARAFLESQQERFKVGVLFSRAKTEQEKKRRQNAFCEDVRRHTEAGIGWHLQEMVKTLFASYDLQDDEVLQEAYEYEPYITPDTVCRLVKKGALQTLTGRYVLQYTRELSQWVKEGYRQRAHEWLARASARLQERNRREREETEQAITLLSREVAELERGMEQAETKDRHLHSLRETINRTDRTEPIAYPVDREVRTGLFSYGLLHSQPVLDLSESSSERNGESAVEPNGHGESFARASAALRKATQALRPFSGFEKQIQDMNQHAQRLENRMFTVALFGAFSAGKSSFANALMGESVLPMSPNPTTAAINRIVPPDAEHPHGTVRIIMKSEAQMAEDIRNALRPFGIEAETVAQGLDAIAAMSTETDDPLLKRHRLFLKAVESGYADMGARLGQEWKTSMETFSAYVASEEKCAFIERMDVHYRCALTERGISLVDTPGADSIHARHTGVSFEYIKQADAVLYVTYYNHAFSKADQAFVMQLGRVKDTFELDKMFFLVNAADLAGSKDELQQVVTHVKAQLAAFGIRTPRIYPVSSREALAGRSSGLSTFKADFFAFTKNELTAVALRSVSNAIQRERRKLETWLAEATDERTSREERVNRWNEVERAALRDLEALEWKRERQTLENEIRELMYHLQQRVFFGFSDFYRDAFHPSVLKDDGRPLKKTLHRCMNELQRALEHDVGQELRATFLRVEKQLNRSLQTMGESMHQTSLRHLGVRVGEEQESLSLSTPDFSCELPAGDEKPLNRVLSGFKGVKAFFEKGGKEAMKPDVEQWFRSPVEAYLQQQTSRLIDFFLSELERSVRHRVETEKNAVRDYIRLSVEALQGGVDTEALRGAIRRLETLETETSEKDGKLAFHEDS